jgi:hypothetical protein
MEQFGNHAFFAFLITKRMKKRLRGKNREKLA